MSTADLSKLTAIIKTFQRPKSLNRLIRSLEKHYPDMQILVADDSQQPMQRKDVNIIELPFNVGVSEGRNALLARLRTPYFLLLDDDLQLQHNSQIERLLEVVVRGDLDIAAGNLLRCKRKWGIFHARTPQPGHGTFELAGRSLTVHAGHRNEGDGFLWCDITHNFFVARTDKIRGLGGWNATLQLQEREEFFLRAHRQGIRVGFCPETTAWHWDDRPKAYLPFRSRDFSKLAVEEMGLVRLSSFDGQTIEMPGQARAA